jgi:hypothetical protein
MDLMPNDPYRSHLAAISAFAQEVLAVVVNSAVDYADSRVMCYAAMAPMSVVHPAAAAAVFYALEVIKTVQESAGACAI